MSRVMAGLMDLPWSLVVLLKVSAVLAAGWALHFSLARRNPHWRVLAWRVVLIGTVLAPLLMPLSYLELAVGLPPEPEVRVSALATSGPVYMVAATEPPESPMAETDRDGGGWGHLAAGEAGLEGPAAPPFSIARWARENVWTILAVGWALGALAQTARWVLACVRVRRMVRAAAPADQSLRRALDRVAKDLRCGRRVALRCSADFTTPFLAGVFRPVIVLPQRLAEPVGANELPGVLAHEVAHLMSGDLHWMSAATWISVLLWFHPLAWRLRNAYGSACEEACDAVAAGHVGDAESYRVTLARVALAVCGRFPAVAGIPMARSARIMRRLHRLQQRIFAPLPRRRAALWFVVGVLVLACMGGLSLVYAEEPLVVPPGMRVLRFPKDYSMGRLELQPPEGWGPEYNYLTSLQVWHGWRKWRYLGQAQGDVAVPQNTPVRLVVNDTGKQDLSPFEARPRRFVCPGSPQLAQGDPQSRPDGPAACQPPDRTAGTDTRVGPGLTRGPAPVDGAEVIEVPEVGLGATA